MMEVFRLIDVIKSLTNYDVSPSSEEFIFYRGHSDKNYGLIPSIYRAGYILKEDILFKEVIKRRPDEFQNLKSTFDKLVKMQHYGIPTRLLDITTNPLVALYFACKHNHDKNGELIVFVTDKKNVKYYDSDTVSVLSNLARRPIDFEINTSGNIKDFNAQKSISYLLHEIKEEKPYFQNIINSNHLDKVYVVKAKHDNLRIIKQAGEFLIFGINIRKIDSAQIEKEWIKLRYEIPAGSKQLILEELEIIGIDESTLFPELENQANELKARIGMMNI
jgi:hypothetical protein